MTDAATRFRRTAATAVGALAGSVVLADVAAAHTETGGTAHPVAAPAHLFVVLAVFAALVALAVVVGALRRSARTGEALAATASQVDEPRLAEV